MHMIVDFKVTASLSSLKNTAIFYCQVLSENQFNVTRNHNAIGLPKVTTNVVRYSTISLTNNIVIIISCQLSLCFIFLNDLNAIG